VAKRKAKSGVNGGGIISQEYEMVPVGALTPNQRNANQGDLGAVLGSIKTNRFYGAVMAQKSTGTIIAGEYRWRAAQEAGLEVVPVIWLDVSNSEAQRIMAADNRTCRVGIDDPLKMSELLNSIISDFGDLEGTGYDREDLDRIIADLGGPMVEPERPEPECMKPLKGVGIADLAPTDEERAILTGRKLLIEYSGGKDSSAAAIWARHYFPDSETELLFVDLGADFIGFHLYLHDASLFLGVPLVILRSKQTVIEAMLEKGEWPHPLYPYCHQNLHQPLDDYTRQFQPADIVILRGGRLSERAASGKKNESRFLVVDRMEEYKYFQPLYFSDKSSSEKLLEEAGLPIWDGYGRGLCRTACRVCPGQKPRAYAAIRREFPDVWAELLDLEGRFGPGGWSDPANLHAAKFGESADRGQGHIDRGEPDDEELAA